MIPILVRIHEHSDVCVVPFDSNNCYQTKRMELDRVPGMVNCKFNHTNSSTVKSINFFGERTFPYKEEESNNEFARQIKFRMARLDLYDYWTVFHSSFD